MSVQYEIFQLEPGVSRSFVIYLVLSYKELHVNPMSFDFSDTWS